MHHPNQGTRPLLRATAAALLLASTLAHGQAYPSKPISLVVPFPPGGTTDALGRALGDELGKSLGQPVIIDTKPGAGSTIGADYVAKARPDGYTLLLGAVHHTIATSAYKHLTYNFSHDFAPITTAVVAPNLMTVNPNKLPVKSVGEWVTLVKASPGKYSFGSNGNGTAQHLLGAQIQNATGVTLLHVPYKGSGPLTTDLIGGQVDMSFDTITSVQPHVKSGRLRTLATVTDKRIPQFPDVPTLDEAGIKGVTVRTWFGILAPAGTPKDIVTHLNAEMVKVMATPTFKQRMYDIGCEIVADSPEQMAARIKDDTERFAKLVKAAGVSVD
ncbi:MAG TPA: tripartite tricarboxylate transporter substrate binding protein [Burkholderiales bacterium]|jgi:tripartite-type tricarboxylate transporter receptor subunit TctC